MIADTFRVLVIIGLVAFVALLMFAVWDFTHFNQSIAPNTRNIPTPYDMFDCVQDLRRLDSITFYPDRCSHNMRLAVMHGAHRGVCCLDCLTAEPLPETWTTLTFPDPTVYAVFTTHRFRGKERP